MTRKVLDNNKYILFVTYMAKMRNKEPNKTLSSKNLCQLVRLTMKLEELHILYIYMFVNASVISK